MKLTINFKPGSDFQRESGKGNLIAISKAFKEFYEGSHKKNKVEVELLEDDNKRP